MAWTIRWRIVARFGIVLAAMVIMGTVSYTGLARIREEAVEATSDSLPGLSHSMAMNSALLDTFVAMEQFALQPDQAGRERLLLQLQAKRRELDLISTIRLTARAPRLPLAYQRRAPSSDRATLGPRFRRDSWGSL